MRSFTPYNHLSRFFSTLVENKLTVSSAASSPVTRRPARANGTDRSPPPHPTSTTSAPFLIKQTSFWRQKLFPKQNLFYILKNPWNSEYVERMQRLEISTFIIPLRWQFREHTNFLLIHWRDLRSWTKSSRLGIEASHRDVHDSHRHLQFSSLATLC